MWLAPDSGHNLLRNPLLHASEMPHRGVCGAGQSGGCILCHSDPYAEPHDLRPQEQGCERGIEKSNRETKIGEIKYYCHGKHFKIE